MGVHKLTAGDGYTYLTRQVAAHDATDRGHTGLADYYAEKGESPGRWFGTGLDALDLEVGSQVTETQMRNLFGEGRHPDAERLENAALDAGKSIEQAKRATHLGRVFARYLGQQPEFIRETAQRYIAYNLAHGEHWKTPVPADVRARIRTDLGNERFQREHRREPIDDRERGSFMAKATRQQTTAVAGYDLTFAPVKSVSTLWALADRDVAKEIESAHHSAVEATLSWLEQEVLFTRRGRDGIQQVPAVGLIAGMFTHRDARSSDPHLHTHVAVSNKVQDESGRWLAVDGRVLFKANVTLAEMYNTLIEAELVARLGVQFEDRRSGPRAGSNKRPIREIIGVDERLARTWSKRHLAIEARRRDLATAFQAEHGRPPTEGEAVTLADQAWEQTRQAKHAPRAEADQREAWLAEAAATLGSDHEVRDMVEACLGHHSPAQEVTEEWVAETAQRVVARVAEDRATWQVWHLRAEAQRQARAHGMGLSDLDTAVDRVTAAAIHEHSIAFTDPDPLTHARTAAQREVTIPAPLRRTEHAVGGLAASEEIVSVYSLAGARQYTSRAVLDAERSILEHARHTSGRTITAVRVAVATAQAAAHGLHLNAAQQALVREMATSGRAVQLALAPAGTGKTTAMQVLTHAWQDSGGTVIGLAPSAVAAQELGAAINLDSTTNGEETAQAAHDESPTAGEPKRMQVRADTLTKLVWHAQSGDGPEWIQRIDHKTLVLIDEAGMAATTDLAAAIDHITSRGGQVRLVGDDRQLSSVAAGGVLRDIAHQVGAATLSEVHRFRNPDGSLNHAEAAATLALREGDPSAIAFYADRGRIHVGDLGACADQAYAAWAADHADAGAAGGSETGFDSILVAPTRELVAELNTRARNDRIAALDAKRVGRVLTLGDGTQVSTGDRIITRENDRRLRMSRTNWVKNGDRWHVTHVNPDGSLRVVHHQLGTTVTLPADYVTRAVQLGYATTVHGAQGITTGTCHVVVTGDEDRNLLYVALSRGRYANHLYLNVASDGDPHNLIRPEALIPPTALDRIATMLRRDGSPVSATTTLREQTNPHHLLRDAAARYHDAVTAGAEHLIGPAGMDTIDAHAEALLTGLTEAPAWSTLRSHLALLALAEHNPRHLLTQAAAVGPLGDARDSAAVLDARVDALLNYRAVELAANPPSADTRSPATGPVPWLPGIPTRLADAPDWGPFTAAYHQQVAEQIDAVREHARRWSSATAPVWAQPFLEDEDADLRADLAVWRAISGTDDTDLRPTGERTIGAPGLHQAKLTRAVRAARPSYPFAQRTWYQAVPDTVRTDPWITPLCQRLARLERAGLPVTDYVKAALASDPATAGNSGGDCGERNGLNPSQETDTVARPLPDEQQAAALWWRIVPHLGPAVVEADEHSANLLQPPWRAALTELVGPTKADYLHQAPAWPALVAAVDEAGQHHGWSPGDILASALTGLPQDGSLTGIEIADALVLRIAMLTDQPADATELRDADGYTQPHTPAPWTETDVLEDPDLLPPADADTFLTELYRQEAANGAAEFHSPASHEYPDTASEDPELPSEAYGLVKTWDGAAANTPYVPDPYAVPLPCERAHSTTWELAGKIPGEITAEHAFPDPNEIPPERIHELNEQALTYFTSCYPDSWAPEYLRLRIGDDLTDHPAYAVGYAPTGGRSLSRHLTAHGATLHELTQAGLVTQRQREDGTTYHRDFFRDRLVMPIRDPHDPTGAAILGFIGRRNPTKTDHDFAGPKYLNTRNTTIFTKGEALFGYAEARDLLADGALPVIVEGPMDALAITLGSSGAAAGLAPMGTSLTVNQVRLLRAATLDPHHGRDHIAVATDSDAAGWTSAQKAYWHLTSADLDPTLLDLPTGLDPATLFETEGAGAIVAAIANRVPLADAMINHLLRTAGHWSETVVRQNLIHEAARILCSRSPEQWPQTFQDLPAKLRLAPGILEHQTLTESIERDRNLPAYALARIAEITTGDRNETDTTGPQPSRRRTRPGLATPRTPTPHQPDPGGQPPQIGPEGPAR